MFELIYAKDLLKTPHQCLCESESDILDAICFASKQYPEFSVIQLTKWHYPDKKNKPTHILKIPYTIHWHNRFIIEPLRSFHVI